MLHFVLSIVVGGLLGHAVDAGYNGRLFHYINSPQSEAIALFSPEVVEKGRGGWRGEHAGREHENEKIGEGSGGTERIRLGL